jgi:hypothetical protein
MWQIRNKKVTDWGEMRAIFWFLKARETEGGTTLSRRVGHAK